MDKNSLDFKKLFEFAPGLYLVLSPDLVILAVSEAYLSATMTRREDIIGRPLFEVFPDNPNDPNATGVRNLKISLKQVLKNKVADAMAVQKYDIRRPDSEGGGFEERYWSPVNSPVFDDKGQVQYIVHAVEDVTEFVRLKEKGIEQEKLARDLRTREEKMEAEVFHRAQQLQQAHHQLREAHEKLKESDRIKDEFLANISHELRTPLTLIIAPLETLITEGRRDNNLTMPQRQFITTVHNNALRLLELVNGLLDFSKLGAGRFDVKREPTNITALTGSIVADFQPLMRERDITVSYPSQPEGPLVDIDRYLYERILFNLLSNAMKFTPAGGQITVATSFDRDRLRLSVKDTGIGIAPEDQGRLFQRFRQIDGAATRRFGGTGLGLVLTKEFSALLEGNITVVSAPGQGSEFVMECKAPRSDGREAAGKSRVAVPQAVVKAPKTKVLAPADDSNGLPKVLIAEDNEELAEYIADVLGNFCHTRVARDGEAAWELIREWDPEAILSDVMMPALDGVDLCKRIKADPRTSLKPVILLTALTHREALLKGWEAGADEYLFKPFYPNELIARIKSILALIEERRCREEERNRLREFEDFSWFASHDLQEPLRIIVSYTQLLRKRFSRDLGEEGEEFISFIVKAGVRMQQLLRGLIEYDRIASKANVLADANCEELLAQALEKLDISIAESKARVTHGKLPTLRGYPTQLQQLFQNLISNAIKYRKDGVPPQIHIEAKRIEDGWLFTVKDNGIGIPKEYVEQVFVLFRRLHNQEAIPGTGVGLSLCKRIVENAGGRIWVESQPPEGSTFYFTIPDREQK